MKAGDDIRDFATEEAARAWAERFLEIWGGSSPWSPYSPTVIVQPPAESRPHWRVIGSRNASAE